MFEYWRRIKLASQAFFYILWVGPEGIAYLNGHSSQEVKVRPDEATAPLYIRAAGEGGVWTAAYSGSEGAEADQVIGILKAMAVSWEVRKYGQIEESQTESGE